MTVLPATPFRFESRRNTVIVDAVAPSSGTDVGIAKKVELPEVGGGVPNVDRTSPIAVPVPPCCDEAIVVVVDVELFGLVEVLEEGEDEDEGDLQLSGVGDVFGCHIGHLECHLSVLVRD